MANSLRLNWFSFASPGTHPAYTHTCTLIKVVLYANPVFSNVINELKCKVTYLSLSVCAEWGLSIISWMTLVAIHQGEVRGVSKGGKAGWMGRRGHERGGRAAAVPWVDLTSVTLMAFVFAAKPDVSEPQFHTPQSEVQHRRSHTTTYTC